MDDTPKPPVVFANRVIREMVDHSLGEDMVILPEDYTAIRTAYRWCGGMWEKFDNGDLVQIDLLSKIVNGWGGLPNRVRKEG